MAKNVLTKASIIRIIVMEKLKRGLIYFILAAGCIIFLYPIIYAVNVSFFSPEGYENTAPTFFPYC